eukprot:12857275-Alexandrium_andersonii.AAC.1
MQRPPYFPWTAQQAARAHRGRCLRPHTSGPGKPRVARERASPRMPQEWPPQALVGSFPREGPP